MAHKTWIVLNRITFVMARQVGYVGQRWKIIGDVRVQRHVHLMTVREV